MFAVRYGYFLATKIPKKSAFLQISLLGMPLRQKCRLTAEIS
jgi:hypothetical protein